MSQPPPRQGIQGAWGPFPQAATPGPGGGTVQSVTGSLPGVVDNTDPTNPIVQAQFGPDTTLQLPNSATTLVDALELVCSFINDTPGAEATQWLAKVLLAGSQVDAFLAKGNQFVIPAGDFPTAPGLAFFGGHEGIGRIANALTFFVSDAFIGELTNGGQLFLPGGLLISGLAPGFLIPDSELDSMGAGGAGLGVVNTQSRFETNKGADVASISSVHLGNDGNYFVITGNTTIDGINFDQWQSGSRICLQLPAGITITNNSGTPGSGAVSILLRAGVDLTTAAPYFLELWYNGTNWVQPS